ncbi:Thioesterase/thiol ester dehydrase-isomerase [Punctularia strigosozonata HHB-11173 SS5]|uniref:Thioesterase/thiol ester dehydrase-isomerase n=1 Tax=Punctularia strigosozonata (strain HHB-11173) TaxID=741275 RepID=UPI0004416E5E|nr:Thioesterase/thiol ester dehydrase-isomerase [Punctularia strigosozonata HHB-11173 SS5]EIN05400.1 Thioesterase/thiol ester dehydrase-isomerase [Punctularia strigosozonata HHB-11173 SS5]
MSTSRILRRLVNARRPPTFARSQSTSSSQNPPPRRVSSLWSRFSAATFLSLTAYGIGSLYPPSLATFISPRTAPPPLHPEHPAAIAHTVSLEESLQSLPPLKAMREAPDADQWYETRPYLNFPEERRVNNLTAGALRGPGKLATPPLVRARKDESEAVIFLHVGRGLCGHDGIVHGGLLATLLDESLGRIAIVNVPEKVAVTARLTVDYKAPTKADQFIVIKASVVEKKGRKVVTRGVIEDLEGTTLVEASGIFIQPRYAKLLNPALLKQAMGEPDQQSRLAPQRTTGNGA